MSTAVADNNHFEPIAYKYFIQDSFQDDFGINALKLHQIRYDQLAIYALSTIIEGSSFQGGSYDNTALHT